MKTEMELESEILGSQELQVEAQKDEQEEQHFHVLAVDDSLIDRKLLERLLHVSSYKVTSVDSGDKALKYLGLLDDIHDNASPTSSESSSSSSSPYSSQQSEGIKVNMIMTDYCMPGMSGYDLLKRVKLQGSSWKDVPVVVMSSENVPSRISMCLEEGAEEFLLKPLQLSDLEKLHPYLVKSINTSPCCCDQQQQSANSSMATNTTDNDDDDDNIGQSNNKSSGISKRKATSPEPPERSKSKTKGFGVA